jgi:hypothetical protein
MPQLQAVGVHFGQKLLGMKLTEAKVASDRGEGRLHGERL